MKILFSITYYHPYISGLTLAASRWAEALVRAKETVTVLAMSGRARSGSVKRVRVVIAKPLMKVSKGFVSLDWLIQSWRLTGNHDVTVIHLPQFEGVIPALSAKIQGKRVVAVYHCEISLPKSIWNTVVESLLEVSHFCTLLLADSVVTYTSDYAKHSRLLRLFSRYRKRDVVSIVPPIPTLKYDRTLVKEFKERIGPSGLVIGVAARLASEKGIEYLLQAIPYIMSKHRVANVKVVIAGPTDPVGEDSYKTAIMKLVEKQRNNVCFLGSIAPEDMGSFYRSIDVLVLPSVNSTESFGMVQVEAMLCGVPVVASDLAGVREPIAKTGMGYTVVPKDARALAQAITLVFQHKERYLKPYAAIRRKFAIEESVRRMQILIGS